MQNSIRASDTSVSFDYSLMASELLRALRGSRRSRPGFSRHLGYRSNIAQRWETGLAWPTADSFFSICESLRIDVRAALGRFLRRQPAWLPSSPRDALPAELLRELRGRTRLSSIAARTPYHRSSISRWLDGTRKPKLPELLCMIDALSGRSLDFIAAFTDPKALPSIARRWEELALSRELAYAHPLSHAVLRALELDDVPRGRRDASFVSQVLNLEHAEVERSLALLVQSGQAEKTRHGYRTRPAFVVDTGSDPERARGVKLTWAELAVRRLRAGAPGQCGYVLCAISRQDLRRLQEIQLTFVREMQALIAASAPSECVALFCSQLLDLGGAPVGAPRAGSPSPPSTRASRTTRASRA